MGYVEVSSNHAPKSEDLSCDSAATVQKPKAGVEFGL